MPAFSYVAVDANGARTRGRLEAANADALTGSLKQRGLWVLRVDAAAERRASTVTRAGNRRGVLEFTRAVAALLSAGMPLSRAISAAAALATPRVTIALDSVCARVQRGDALADALADHPELFTPLYVGLVRAGERSGTLAASFERLGAHLEREDDLRSKLISLSIYPILLACVGAVAVAVLLVFVLPRFTELLQGAGATLPTSTATLLAASHIVRRFWYVWLMVFGGLAALLVWMRSALAGRHACARLLLALPLIRSLRRHTLSARFARVTGVLLSGGSPLLAALDDCAQCMGDPVASEEVVRVRARVREGAQLHASLGEGGVFDAMLAQLVAVGEESGRLATFLLKAADILEHRTERAAERAVVLVEPAMIVAFGGIVAFVALSLLQAIYGVNAGAFR